MWNALELEKAVRIKSDNTFFKASPEAFTKA